jgi:hypothetical protein
MVPGTRAMPQTSIAAETAAVKSRAPVVPTAGGGCSVPLDHCADSIAPPGDYARHIDYSWIPQPVSDLESALLADSLRIPPLLQTGCEQISDADKHQGGEWALQHVLAKAALLRLIEQKEGLSALRLAFTGRPPIQDVGGTYRKCLDLIAPGWLTGSDGADTTPGWHEVIADIAAVPAMIGTPGTTEIPACRGDRPYSDWDVTMALVIRVWGLAQDEPDKAFGEPRADVENMFAQRAWLQGGAADVDETVCHVPNPFPPFIPPVLGVPETENHRFLIRTTRFLHNDLLPIVNFGQVPHGSEVDNYDVNDNRDNDGNGLTGILSSWQS